MTFRFRAVRPLCAATVALCALGCLVGTRPARAQRQAAAALKASVNPPSVKEIMTKIGKGPQALGPAIGQGLKADSPNWQMLEPRVKEYNELAAALGRNDPPRGSKESWTELTTAFAESATELEKAVRARDRQAALVANDQLANSCMACHRAHRGGPGMMGMPPGGPPPGGFAGPGGGPPPGRPPGPGGEAGAPTSPLDEPAATPEAAVRAFLAALEKSDAKVLAKTVSRRAPAELVIRAHKKTLESILSKKIATADIAKLKSEFDGFELESKPVAAATDKATVLLTQGDVHRKVYVRRDGDAWKVVDYSGKIGAASKTKTSKAR